MKYLVTISFFVMTVVQTFSKMMLVLGYEWNKDYIASNLCINRDKPKSCCHGKCFLNKKMGREDSPQSNSGERTVRDLSESLFFPVFAVNSSVNSIYITPHSAYYQEASAQEYVKAFFHPPQTC
jgi:hypothetical protein